MAKRKHNPKRTCIVCREIKDKRELIRVVRTSEGKIIVDPTGKANGRGAYLCQQVDCWQKVKSERLAQALKVKLTPEELATLYVSLQNELSKV